MAKDYNRAIKLGYDIKVISGVTLKVKEYDTSGMIVRCEGTTVPVADSAGFAKGCIFVDTDAADGTKGMYENIGTTSASDFNVIGDVTTADIADASITAAKVVEVATATATADGLTTGAIAALTGFKKFVAVTSAGATNAITLPAASASTIGQEVFLTVGANGYELLTVAGSNVTINQVDGDGTNQLDVAANTTVRCTQISATAWLAETIAATSIAITAPDND